MTTTTTAPPKSSPWGPIQHRKRLADGIWFVSTASHGGIWLSEDRLEQLNAILPVLGGDCSHYPTFCGSPQWWEEDCDWCVPSLAFAVDIDDPTAAEAAQRQLAGMSQSMGGKYTRAWEALR